MFLKIKNKIEKELTAYIRSLDRLHALSRISPVLFKHIQDFLCREGKRIRPVLFVIGYQGFTKRNAAGIYRSAVSLELLHDFLLVHDDIIDKSETRRGKPSMHAMLNRYLAPCQNLKFNGQDLSIVVGDVIYALALHAFLAVRENKDHKEAALKKLIEAAIYTGSGEFIELLSGTKKLERINKNEIYKIYDYKTANYTFATPLVMGALLAGADKKQADILFKYGILLGRAFQIKDDILGIFGEKKETGKSNLTDLKEAKKTVLIWYAYRHSDNKNKAAIKRIFSKNNVGRQDLLKMRRIIRQTGALDYAQKEISALINQAEKLSGKSRLRRPYINSVNNYARKLLVPNNQFAP
jgi:geranylgeranyl diphosphate synthase, type I